MRKDFMIDSDPPPNCSHQGGLKETQTNLTTPLLVSKLSRVARLTLSYWSMMLMLTVRLPEATANTYSTCQIGWYQSGALLDQCSAYYGGFTSSSSIPTGTYAFKGTSTTTTGPAGYDSAGTGHVFPTQCSAGTYSLGGTSACIACPAANNCQANTASGSCNAGFFTFTGSGRWKVCLYCPAGYTCAGGSSAPVQIAQGGGHTTGGQNSGPGCSAGNYCPDTARSNEITCPTNHYSAANQGACVAVSAGYVSSGSSQTQCLAGYYSKYGSNSCMTCPWGYYCTAGTASPTPCPTGTYSTGGAGSSGACTQCPYQYQCSMTAQGSVCPNGYTSAAGSSICTKCQSGYYCQNGAQTICIATQWSDPGATSCTTELDGYERDGAERGMGTMCGVGYYSDSTTNYYCTVCPQGYYCPSSSEKYWCTSTYYCPPGSTDLVDSECPPWYDCTNYQMCADGQYLALDKVTCNDCPAGFTCAGRSESTNTAVNSALGYYSPVGESPEYICPAGYACSGSVLVECTDGWTSIEGDLVCTICPILWACPSKQLVYTDQIDCRQQRGMYGLAAAALSCTPAAAGTYIQIGSTVPTICPQGTWSSGADIGCHECPPGYICPSKVQPQMEKCIVGTYNLLWNQIVCLTCEAGRYCDGESVGDCPTYKYSHSGWGICKFAPQGYYLQAGDQTQIIACPTGTYAIFGSGDSTLGISTCQTCPVGHYCLDPTKPPQACEPGTIQPITGQTSCTSCGAGTYSLFRESECHTSPAGYKLSVASAVPRMCHAGTYSAAGDTACSTTAEYYYTQAGSSNLLNLGECPWGFYCSSDGTTQVEYPMSDKSTNALGSSLGGQYYATIAAGTATADNTFTTCDAGYYCPFGTMKRYPCPAGHYCAAQTSLPTPCGGGYFNIHIMQVDISACTNNPCPTNYYCNIGSKYPQPCSGSCDSSLMAPGATIVTCLDGTYSGNDSPTTAASCNACWEGHYCPSAVATEHTFPLPCPKGTYSASTSLFQESDCDICPEGMVCPYYGARTLETGLVCQGGYACPAGTIAFRESPCPAGFYSDATPYLDLTANCVVCPDGFMCTEGTNVLFNPMTVCTAGSYCVAGVKTDCPAGTYSTQIEATSADVCLSCPAGFYCEAATTDYSANVCDAGYYCPEGSSTATPYSCPDGSYSTLSGMKSSTECTICPIGYYCLVGTTTPVVCPAGTYSSRISIVVEVDVDGVDRGCITCPAGYICDQAPTYEPEACPVGSYSAAGAIVCEDCPVNYYCDNEATTDTAYTLIEDGFYYSGGVGLNERPYHISTLYSCLPGYYCAANTQTACVVGTYQPLYGQTTVAACLTTPAGYYNNVVASTDFFDYKCPTGMYCHAGTSSAIGYALTDGRTGYPFLCPKGTFRSQKLAKSVADCGECPAGYVCSEMTTNPQICSPGYYCPQGSESMQACPTGTFGSGYGLTAIDDCSPCFGGRYCSAIAKAYVSGLCDQMYYCVQNSNTPVPLYKTVGSTTDFSGRVFPVGDECAAGGYCAAGSKFPLPCPAGQYYPYTRAELVTQCLDCPQGKYCSGAPTLLRTDILDAMKPYVPAADPTGDCYAGYYCTGAAYSAKQFTAGAGKWTAAGAYQEEDCAVGTYNPYTAQSSCLPCPAGYYCDTVGMSTPTDCPFGYYCPAGIVTYLTYPCPSSTYGTQTNLQQSSECQDCTSGVYCFGTGQTASTGDCLAGYYCLASSTVSNPTGTSGLNGQCPQHHWCAIGVGMGVPSLPGFYETTTQMSIQSTVLMTQGYWSHTVSATSTYFSTPTMATGDCAIGYYCPAGSTWAFDETHFCSVTENCPLNSYQISTCAAGTYQPNPLQDRCYVCPAGFYCTTAVTNDLTDFKCPKGYYCPDGTASEFENPCPAGTYNDHFGATNLGECVDAPPGYYQSGTAAIEITSANLCSEGYYCTLGSITATPISGTGGQCTAGNYCPEGAPQMISCTPGQKCTTVGLGSPDADCAAGYYCPQGTSTTGSVACPPGFYCPIATPRPLPCPAGTYQPNSSQDEATDCTDCMQAFYCPESALTSYTAYQCLAGFYCPTGSKVATQNICSLGNYCPTNSYQELACSALDQYQDETGASDCKWCPTGHFCDSTSFTKCEPQLEGLNYYCLGGAVSVGKTYCADGYYNFVDGSDSNADCWICPEGYFCPNDATTTAKKIQICTQGYYCLAGTETPTICPVGFFCPEGTNVPVPCPAGYYGASAGLYTAVCSGGCTAGYYCDKVTYTPPSLDYELCLNENSAECYSGSTSATQYTCPQGHYCGMGTIIPTPCPIGTYSAAFGNDALADCIDCTGGYYCFSRGLASPQVQCEVGYFCPVGSDDAYAEECPTGYYCPYGSEAAVICPVGTFQANEVQSSCTDCPLGWYCDEQGMTLPLICPTGYYCGSTNVVTPSECPLGTWSYTEGLTALSECMPCPYGKYCTFSVDNLPITSIADATECPDLYSCYDITSAGLTYAEMTSEHLCVAGEVCATNTIVPGVCEPGQYANPLVLTGVTTSTDLCISCPVEKYCPDWGLTESDLQDCPDGYVCMGGAIHPSNLDDVTIKLCPAGSYCKQIKVAPDTEIENLCKFNYYNPIEGQTACFPCEAGFSCQETGLELPNPCPTGHYCPLYDPLSGVDNVVPCPAGTYNYDLYLTSVDKCVDCPPGKYCEIGSSGFTGYCDEGYVCTGGQADATPSGTFDFLDYDNSKSGLCPVGHYCPFGSSYPRKCPSGQYQDLTGQSDCKECDEGSYCASAGLSAPTGTCSPGFYCISGSEYYKPYDFSSGRICAVGHYCVIGLEFDCPGGRYAPVEGLSLCYDCPPGFYCNKDGGTIAPEECTTGSYCPDKTTDPIQCEEGTYTRSYMTGLESQDQCADCPSGYFCNDGTFDRTNKCDAGFYCHSGAFEADEDGLECAPGYYCPEGTKLPIACPDGLYSEEGAESEDDCEECKAGYYCVRYVSSAAMIVCPVGYYCPQGVNEPLACPKGTYNTYTKSVTIDRCLECPAGTACDVTGISNFNRKMCPPGYYCEKGSFAPTACPPGMFRPNQGAGELGPVVYSPNSNSNAAACYSCVPGYYCPTKATVVPELCPKGSYCKIGSIYETKCPAGYYCNAGSAVPTQCPPGFYCMGGSDTYLKCPFGTYCPEKSGRPSPCPNGMYGSGSVKNFDLKSGCKNCGRGMYSEDDPTQCMDCTPGYVCLGATSSAQPLDKVAQGGFICPVGFYCPLGSYEASYCPVGTYSKKEGSKSIQKCLPCKVDWYNDLPGQGGCKKCGPTSYSDGGATTCQCVGANRDFIKSVGSCLCATGFQPKNGAANVDSLQDCEQIVREGCASDEKVDLTGKCVNAEQEKKICDKQCVISSGTFVDGTGLCQCDELVDIQQVCTSSCVKMMPKQTAGADGMLSVADPVTNKVSLVDPSSIPGYYGNFKCETTNTATTDCKVLQMGMLDDGSFTYEYQPNEDILEETKIPSNSQFRTDVVRRVEFLKRNQGRLLQNTVEQTTIPRLRNPAMCIQEGTMMFFNVVPALLNYPVYYKDSFLNNNPYFDYGPFLELEKMIEQGVEVSTFSFIFKEAGVYVFTNKASGTMTTITVVLPSQECEGQVDGVSVSMVTKESLSNFGIKSGEKGIQPDWWFISLSMIAILSFLFLIMGLFLRAHNAQIKGTKLLANDAHTKSASIYYDKILKDEKDNRKSCCCGMFSYRVSKVSNKNDDSSDSSDLDQTKKTEYAVKYKDLERLLADFNRAQEVLNRQLIDTEGANKRTVDEDGNLVETLSNEDSLLKEVQALLTFVKQNRACLNNALGENQNQTEETNEKKQDNIDNQFENQFTRKIATAMSTLIAKGIENEKTFNTKIESKAKDMQKQAYEKEAVRNDQMKQKLLDEYEKRLLNKNVNEKEREALLAELHAKMSHINDLAAEEQHNQNHNLNDMLARRRAKKQKLQVVVNNLGDKKIQEEDRYQNAMVEIRQKELDDKKAVDQEMEEVRNQGMRDIQSDLDQKRLKSISESEQRLEDFKRKQGKGHNPEAELKFADMLAEYGNQVKKLDANLSVEKQKQVSGLEDRIKNRKQARLREVEEQRKQKEQLLNSDTVNNNAKLTTEMKQIECLLNPIKDEDVRMEIILSQNKPEKVIVATVEDKKIELSAEAKKAQAELAKSDEDKKVIAQILVKIDVENEVKRREIENQKEMINRQLQNCNSEDERQRLLKQLEIFDANLQAQLAQQQEVQNKKLKEAIEARKQKRRVLKDNIAYEKELAIKKEFQKSSKGKVIHLNHLDKVKQLTNRIQAGFSKDEAVQVTENLLDQKAQQEAVDLMNSLFEERAKALRQFMLDLLTQKQQEFDDLADEYEPQREFLRQKRVKQLLTLEEFTAALERITVEETERHQDIEIAYADKEKSIKEELELLKMQADNEQMKSLKDRQTQEKILMYQELMKNMDDKDQMKVYLTKSVNEAIRDLDQYKRHVDKEKQSRIQDMQSEHERKQKEMEERQDRLVNVEEMLKKDEAKHMERFRRQREEMLARKLGEQQRELLKDMNQKDVDSMLDRHKRDLGAMDEVLQDEQQRQMVKMRDRMKNRNAAKAKEQVLRQIKLAEIQKEKSREVEQAKLYEQAGGDLATSVALEKQKAEIGRLVEKASLMQRMCQKQCYSRKIYFKRHIANQQKLNQFLGRGIMADWASSKGGYPDDVSGMSQLSLNTEDLKQQVNEKEEKVTYAVLLQHIQTAQETYDQIRKQDK